MIINSVLGRVLAVHMLYTVRNIVDQCVSRGSSVNLCAIDLSKAFDKVNHYALLIKLMKRHKLIPVPILEIIENLFLGCCTCIKWGNSWSTVFQIESGVSQGSVLSTFLFAIYLDDLAALSKPNCNLYIILYADDILLLAPTVTALENSLHDCECEIRNLDVLFYARVLSVCQAR